MCVLCLRLPLRLSAAAAILPLRGPPLPKQQACTGAKHESNLLISTHRARELHGEEEDARRHDRQRQLHPEGAPREVADRRRRRAERVA